ncbi:zinc dependent phospholipase C family protein [Pelomyxa schiedti]|nr:zinc dependent phospholipase C family protein [Pelomyxa schiedti]
MSVRLWVVFLALSLWESGVSCHGGFTHQYTTSNAIADLEEGELKKIMTENLNASLVGTIYPDGAYIPPQNDTWGETAHWEPFVQSSIEQMQASFTRSEVISFFFGSACHGFEDEAWDSLYAVKLADDAAVDVQVDSFLANHSSRIPKPPLYIPLEQLPPIYESLGVVPPSDAIQLADTEANLIWIETSQILSRKTDQWVEENQPWIAETVLDPCEPGSIASEIIATTKYLKALYKRLKGTFKVESDIILTTSPLPGSYLKTVDPSDLNCVIAAYLGIGVLQPTLNSTVKLYLVDNDQLVEVSDYSVSGSVFSGIGYSRMVTVRPHVPLKYSATYQVTMKGVPLVDGTTLSELKIFGGEIREVLRLAWPLSVGYFLEMAMNIMCLFILGHIGASELAASSLAFGITSILGFSLGFGLLVGVDTLAAQAWGAGNFKSVGRIAMRASIIISIFCVPITGSCSLQNGRTVYKVRDRGYFSYIFRWMILGLWPALQFEAKLSCWLTILLNTVIEIICGILLLLCRNPLAHLFTTDEEMIYMFDLYSPILSAVMVVDGVQIVSGAAIRGTNHSTIGVILNIIAFYLCGIPLGVALAFAAGLSSAGLWCGIALSDAVSAALLITVLAKTSWTQVAGINTVSTNQTDPENVALLANNNSGKYWPDDSSSAERVGFESQFL